MAYVSENQINRFLIRKLDALNKLSKMLGYDSVPSEEELESRRKKYGFEIVVACVFIILSDAHQVRKAAAAKFLEFLYPNWREYAPPVLVGQILEREDKEVRAWRSAVLRRDGHKCKSCGATKNLHAHHIAQWIDYPELRAEVSNGIALCQPCHIRVHAKT